jgi:hypothetical protein
MNLNPKQYPEWAKMPKDYDFSSNGVDFSDYSKYFRLRTDAVWEKEKLRDYFRLFNKIFYFDNESKNYFMVPPAEISQYLWHLPTLLNTAVEYKGLSRTGMTNSFVYGDAPFKAQKTTMMGNYAKQDYYELCAYRFDKWHECDSGYSFKDKIKMAENYQDYPCFDMFYEAQHSCSDQIFDFMLELSASRMSKNINIRRTFNRELTSMPLIYDAPDVNNRTKLTY